MLDLVGASAGIRCTTDPDANGEQFPFIRWGVIDAHTDTILTITWRDATSEEIAIERLAYLDGVLV